MDQTRAVFAIANNKGGVGKTTTAVNLAVGLARKLEEEGRGAVLLVDLDPQGNAADSLGLRRHVWNGQAGKCVSFVLDGSARLTDMVEDAGRPHLGLLPASFRLKEVTGRLVVEHMQAVLAGRRAVPINKVLRERLAPAREVFTYIILDCPPKLDTLQPAVYDFADEVIVPVQAQFLAARGAQQHTAELDYIRAQNEGQARIRYIVPTMIDGRQVMARETMAYLRHVYGPASVATPIPNRVDVKEAPAAGQSVLEYAPGSESAEAYQDLVERIYGR